MIESTQLSRLLVDQGNSRVKLLFCNDDVDTGQLIEIDNNQLDQINVILAKKGITEHTLITAQTDCSPIMVSSVAPSSERNHLEYVLNQQFNATVEWITTTAYVSIEGVLLRNAYIKTDALGVDRWVALAGAVSCFPNKDIIVADFGTATTLDLLRADGQHMGGWIVPGLGAAQDLMQRRLSQLYTPHYVSGVGQQKVSEKWLGRSTSTAIDMGLLQMQAGLLDRFLMQTISMGIVKPKVLLTGGQVNSLLPLFTKNYCHMPRLIFFGINALVNKNNAECE